MSQIKPIVYMKIEFLLINMYISELVLLGIFKKKKIEFLDRRTIGGSYIWSITVLGGKEIWMTYSNSNKYKMRLITKKD